MKRSHAASTARYAIGTSYYSTALRYSLPSRGCRFGKTELTFVAWADASEKRPFDLEAAVKKLTQLDANEIVLPHGQDLLTAVDHVRTGTQTRASELQLLALHDAANAPSEWGPGAGARPVTIDKDRYTAFFTHVLIWPDKLAAFDGHANAPGLGRLAEYLRIRTGQRLIFRALYEQGLKERLEDIEHFRSFEYGIYDPQKKAALAGNTGMIGGLPKLWQKVPSVSVKMGMSRRSRRDAYLPPEVADDVLAMSEVAEQFFDRMVIWGPSKTRKKRNGRPEQVRVDLLSERLRREREIKRSDDGNLPDRDATFKALRDLRNELDADGKLQAAQEARIFLDQSG
jgi:hypothetical protein